MRVLVVGAGVIGSVYGAHLAAAGHSVSVIERGHRANELADNGFVIRDAIDGEELRAPIAVVSDASGVSYDLVFIAVRADQLASTATVLGGLLGEPTLLFFGNNPAGRPDLPSGLPGTTWLGFPGVGGSLTDGTVSYVRIPQQPTALQADANAVLDEIEGSLRVRGFKVQRVGDMDGWLLYHAMFVASIAAALFRFDTDPVALAADRPTLSLMCRAVSEGFGCLRRQRIEGLPRNLAVLHSPLLRPVAIRYWSRTLRSPMGELCFAAHARRAKTEMQTLSTDVLARVGDCPGIDHLHHLLAT